MTDKNIEVWCINPSEKEREIVNNVCCCCIDIMSVLPLDLKAFALKTLVEEFEFITHKRINIEDRTGDE
jgi:hypothetical protein